MYHALLLGEGDDILAVHALHLLVEDAVDMLAADAVLHLTPLQGEGGDAGLVGMAADVAFGHAARHPHGALLAALAGDLEDPHLVGVGQRETLAAVGIAVGAHQLVHHLDGLAAVAGTLQGDVDEVAVVDALGVALVQGGDAAPGGLADGQLVLVDEAHHLVGVRRLRYLDLEPQRTVVVEAQHLAGLVVGGGTVAQLPVARVAVGGIGDEGAAVGAGAARHDEVGAGHGAACDRSAVTNLVCDCEVGVFVKAGWLTQQGTTIFPITVRFV